MEDYMKRAVKSFEKEECHKVWNNKKCKEIGGRKKGCVAWNKGKKK